MLIIKLWHFKIKGYMFWNLVEKSGYMLPRDGEPFHCLMPDLHTNYSNE
jgi:hypothetical protein